jgi:hypothetical protein
MELNTEGFAVLKIESRNYSEETYTEAFKIYTKALTLLCNGNEWNLPKQVKLLMKFFLENELDGLYLYRKKSTEGCQQAIEERNKSLKDFLEENGLPELTEGNEVKTLVSINEVCHIPATHRLKQKFKKRDGLGVGTLNPFNLLNDFWNTHIAFDALIENSEVTLKDGTKTHILVTNAGNNTWGILIEGKENIKNAFDTLRLFGAKYSNNISSSSQNSR